MLLIRRVHAYLGLFIAPSVLFFAFSGGLQLFNLHEAHGSYRPPVVIETLGHLHKDQVLAETEAHHGPPPGAFDNDGHATPDHADQAHDQAPKPSTLALRWFFEVVAVGLATSTLLGLWIGLRVSRTPRLSWGFLIAGVIIPVMILMI